MNKGLTMHNQDCVTNTASTQEKNLPTTQPQEKSAMADSKMMLLFGGMMAVCCALPLLLASGLSLAWFTESPAVAVGVAAIAAVFAWRLSRNGSTCSQAKQGADKAALPSDRA
jgi:hypothetical protein